jgi:hypothetical protein
MPRLIDHIDAISRQKQRGVLFLCFSESILEPPDDWENLTSRKEIIEWLDQNGINWCECGHVANPNIFIAPIKVKYTLMFHIIKTIQLTRSWSQKIQMERLRFQVFSFTVWIMSSH